MGAALVVGGGAVKLKPAMQARTQSLDDCIALYDDAIIFEARAVNAFSPFARLAVLLGILSLC